MLRVSTIDGSRVSSLALYQSHEVSSHVAGVHISGSRRIICRKGYLDDSYLFGNVSSAFYVSR